MRWVKTFIRENSSSGIADSVQM